MNKEEMLKRLQNVEAMEKENLGEKGLDNRVQIDNVKYLGKAIFIQDKEGKKEQIEINVYAVIEDKTIKYYSDDMCLGIETVNVGNGDPAIISSPEYLRTYEKDNPIKDVINNLKLKEREEQEKPLEERTTVSLNELKEKEEKNVTKENKEDNAKKKRKPSYVIEKINPDKAKMEYWQTIKQAFNLPSRVETLAFAYPVSSEDKVDYANITLYMLDKEGYIIDDLKIDDYFEFDTATGNNPMQDETVTLEEDENKGKVQNEKNRTMIRLKAKKVPNPDARAYISLEQKNTLGDYNDINGGSKVKGWINNVQKQLETDHVRVWDAEREKIVGARTGEYKGREIYEEIQRHTNQNKEAEYLSGVDADGIKETFECIKEYDWKELATKWGYYKDGRPDEEKARRVYEEYKYNNPHLSDDEVVQEVSDDLYEQIPGGNSRQ